MLKTVARAAQALAVWKYLESHGPESDMTTVSTHKSHVAHAYQQFLLSAYDVAFALVPRLLEFGEVVTQNEVRYSAAAGGGGFVIQKMNLDPDNPGLFLRPEGVTVPAVVPIPPPSTENWLQLMIDLPEILELLEVK